ncbi:LysR family transcriptional regulator [Pseudooceanicola spongiae]|uniref:LysR family transcriptional regulator n=1 Tax=Pseudooceanicola spongiae TaxID=2613965 RepID=A0A7L9WUC3_9RHOB|nr:LysR family transcriptional regulator [Pseudooceanicola spongiae]QOL82690.1 LysR family transcriptional regulator [Pseudooceanicola spongiae]
MDIRQLKYFIAIAEAGSLSLAARQLHIAQPSLSQHLANMEKELDVRLVARSPRGSTLTAEGQVLLRHAVEICTSLNTCLSEMRDLSAEIAGGVRFGMPPSVSMVMSVPLAETVRIELPDVRLRVSEAMSGFIKTWVDDGTVEIGFLYDLNGAEHFQITHVLNEKLFFFSAPDNWPLQTPPGTPVPLRDLEGIELVLPGEPHGLRRIIEKAAAEAKVRLNVVTELDAMTQIKELVARGSGCSIFAPAACHDFVTAGRMIKTPIIDPVISRPVYLVRNRAVVQTRACAAVEKVTLKVAAEMVERDIWEGELVWSED